MSLKIVNYSDSSSDEEIDVQQIVPVSKIDWFDDVLCNQISIVY